MDSPTTEYAVMPIYRPDLPMVRKIISVPYKTELVNLAAAPDANIIRVAQQSDENYFVLPRSR